MTARATKTITARVVRLSASTTAVITRSDGVDLLRGRDRWHLTPPEAKALATVLQEGEPPCPPAA